MRNMVFAAAVAAVFGMGSASAADLSGGVKNTMFSEPAVVWSGGYVGISGGGGIMMTNSGESQRKYLLQLRSLRRFSRNRRYSWRDLGLQLADSQSGA